jgi:hypothetical protein
MNSFDKLKPTSESGIFFVNYFQPAMRSLKLRIIIT